MMNFMEKKLMNQKSEKQKAKEVDLSDSKIHGERKYMKLGNPFNKNKMNAQKTSVTSSHVKAGRCDNKTVSGEEMFNKASKKKN